MSRRLAAAWLVAAQLATLPVVGNRPTAGSGLLRTATGAQLTGSGSPSVLPCRMG
ncbi:MAG: hypothetical protein ACRDZX_01140 [Acidimicrobiales bacterium]